MKLRCVWPVPSRELFGFLIFASHFSFMTEAVGFLSELFIGLALIRYSDPCCTLTTTSAPPILEPHDVLVTHITATLCDPGSSQTSLPRLLAPLQSISPSSTFRIRTLELGVDSPRTKDLVGALEYSLGRTLQPTPNVTANISAMYLMKSFWTER